MRVLLAYDGSHCAEAAVYDLRRAGLPPQGTAVVVWVVEPGPASPVAAGAYDPGRGLRIPVALSVGAGPDTLTLTVTAPPSPAGKAARLLAGVVKRLQPAFPGWELATEVRAGSPAREVLSKAGAWGPDLIVAGSHGRSALGRFLLGSVSRQLVAEARCPVRVARGRAKDKAGPVRLALGLDGSPDADAAVRAVAARNWPAHSQARLITAIGPFVKTGGELEEELVRAWDAHKAAEALLSPAGLGVSSVVQEGDPKELLLKEAVEWEAECIFVGTQGRRGLGKVLLGSVSAAVVVHAHCSVEVVRAPACGEAQAR